MKRIYIKPEIKSKKIDGDMLLDGIGSAGGEEIQKGDGPRNPDSGTAKENIDFNTSAPEPTTNIWDD